MSDRLPEAKRLAYLDFLRGAAVLLMFETHVFNSFTRLDLRGSEGFVLSQFVGGMAAPLFLFICGITLAWRVEGREDRGLGAGARFSDALKRAGYIWVIALLFRFQLWVFQWRLAAWPTIFKVDILNCMALAAAVCAVVALVSAQRRVGAAILLGSVIAAVAPVAAALDWSAVPWAVRNYIVPSPGAFAFFPCAAYVPFGFATGCVLRRTRGESAKDAFGWIALMGFGLLCAGRFASNQPYSIYAKSEFWINSPGLIVIRTGIMLLMLTGAVICVRAVRLTSWIVQLGTTSLLVYWVHVELVYGWWLKPWKRTLTPAGAAGATVRSE